MLEAILPTLDSTPTEHPHGDHLAEFGRCPFAHLTTFVTCVDIPPGAMVGLVPALQLL